VNDAIAGRGVRIDTRRADDCAILMLAGRLDFRAHRAFKAAYEAQLASPGITELRIDLAGVESLDTSALGVLLILRERGLAANKRVSLVNSRGDVAVALAEAKFAQLFQMG
jgi:HptB-dependent secretion and biofilm anti anti-sigma factor